MKWFADEGIRHAFLSGLHPGASIKTREYPVVVQFILLMFMPDREDYLRQLEDINSIEKNSLNKVQWIKPIVRHAPQQTCGHTILSFSSLQAANKVLANGMFVCQKKVYAEKCKKEPLRCLKCHGWGHMVRDCSAPTDTCGMCAQCHRMDTCMNTAWPHCVSCSIAGHASWDRTCPIFLKKCAK